MESNLEEPTTTATMQSPLPTTDKPVQAADATADETMYEDENPEESSKPPTPPTVSPPSSRRASSDESPNGKSPRSSRIPLAVASDSKPKPEPPAISRIWPPSPGMNRIRPLTTVDAPKKFDFNDTKKDVEEKMEGTKDVKLTDRKDTLQREDSVVLGRMYEEIKEHLKHTFDEIAIAEDKKQADSDMPTVQLSDAQYATLESNRRRLERERQQLRDLGVLS
ncbi:hypothetical protein AAVH_07368 [Aphelenchoides avenae]|nr:hypothetical protein AAVH_07368 [Aphelenchus avenae]